MVNNSFSNLIILIPNIIDLSQSHQSLEPTPALPCQPACLAASAPYPPFRQSTLARSLSVFIQTLAHPVIVH